MMASIQQFLWMASDVAPWLLPLTFGIFGAIFGSFLNCALYRLRVGLPLWRGPSSHCPKCQHKLDAVSLVPILSWLAFLGRCRFCKAPIGQRYLWVEVVTTTSAAALPIFLPTDVKLFLYFILLILVLFGIFWVVLAPEKAE